MNELTKRCFSGFILAGMYIAAVSINNDYKLIMFALCLILAIPALQEYYKMSSKKGNAKPKVKIGIFFLILLILLAYLDLLKAKLTKQEIVYFQPWINLIDYNISLFLGIIFALICIVFIRQLFTNQIEGTILSLSSTLFGLIYVAIPITHLLLLSGFKNSTFYIWITVWATVMSDVMSYFLGKFFGRHKVGFKVSPNKTYEGYIGGLLGQIIITHIFYAFYSYNFNTPDWSPLLLTILCIIIYITSVLGDLSESLIKRDAGVKDSGKTIPGHGGLLDTIDALLFTIPAMYYLIILINKFR